MSVNCPTEVTVERFLAGALDEAGRKQVLGHLGVCIPCCRLLGALMTTGTGKSSGGDAGSLAPTSHSSQDDRALAHYRVGDPIGFGGMGMVYSAYDPRLDRRVALKVLWGDRGAHSERLHREARAMAKLAHPNVVPVFDVGTDRGRVFVAMELVLGGTMRAWLASGLRPYTEVLALFRQAGNGLAAAHQAGLVHRDFKPENLLLRGDGTVLVTDFGLAHTVAPGELVPTQVRVERGSVGTESAGTPAYMAPEQLRGEAVDSRADVYAFSVALWEAIFGQRPFVPGPVESLLASIARGPFLPPPRAGLPPVPGHIPAALARGMAFHPRDRPSSIAELLTACETVPPALAHTSTLAPPRTATEVSLPPAPASRGWLVTVLALAAAASTASAVAVGLALHTREREPSTKASSAQAEDAPRAANVPATNAEPSSSAPLSSTATAPKAPSVAPGPANRTPQTPLARDAGAPPAAPTRPPGSVGMRIRGTDFEPYGFEADAPLARVRAREGDFATCVSAAPTCNEIACEFTVGPAGAVATATCTAWAAKQGECSPTVACLTRTLRAIPFPPPPKPGACRLSFVSR